MHAADNAGLLENKRGPMSSSFKGLKGMGGGGGEEGRRGLDETDLKGCTVHVDIIIMST